MLKRRFRVLFRERGILLFFHAGKMTTHRAKIPRFHCSYFQPCVPVLGHRPVFNIVRETGSCEHSTFSLRLFPACVCFCLDRIGHYFRRDACENYAFLLRLFPDCTIVFPVFENFRKLASEMYKNSGMPYKVMAHYHKCSCIV